MVLKKKNSQEDPWSKGVYTRRKCQTHFSWIRTQASWTDANLCFAVCHTNIIKAVPERLLLPIKMGENSLRWHRRCSQCHVQCIQRGPAVLWSKNSRAERSRQACLYYPKETTLTNICCALHGNSQTASVQWIWVLLEPALRTGLWSRARGQGVSYSSALRLSQLRKQRPQAGARRSPGSHRPGRQRGAGDRVPAPHAISTHTNYVFTRKLHAPNFGENMNIFASIAVK